MIQRIMQIKEDIIYQQRLHSSAYHKTVEPNSVIVLLYIKKYF